MNNNNFSPQQLLSQLGERLKQARLIRNESQELFASRLGITRQSYARMEKGDPTTSVGHWVNASQILGKLESWQEVLLNDENLFDKFDLIKSGRQRAGKQRR
jgi:transcriptional regulator with XRE-family HTH domain